MILLIKKVWGILVSECKTRGIYFTILMYSSYLVGFLRGLCYKIIYLRHIKSSIYFLQANSKIEMFNKHSKINIGRFVFIRKNASIRIDHNGELSIEDKVFINDNCNINCVNKITIGKNTKIGPNVSINDHDHNYKNNTKDHLLIGKVNIGENVWIGSNVVILRDTDIGDHSVIAAGSIVKGHIPANTLFINKRENNYITIL